MKEKKVEIALTLIKSRNDDSFKIKIIKKSKIIHKIEFRNFSIIKINCLRIRVQQTIRVRATSIRMHAKVHQNRYTTKDLH